MEIQKLTEGNLDAYLAYLRKSLEEEPDMMWTDTVDEPGIRRRIQDPFYQNTVSLLAVEGGRVLGRLEYHFYGCMQDGYRMAYVDWVYVRRQFRHRGIARELFRSFEGECRANQIDQYFLIRAENDGANRFYNAFENAQLDVSPTLRKQMSP